MRSCRDVTYASKPPAKPECGVAPAGIPSFELGKNERLGQAANTARPRITSPEGDTVPRIDLRADLNAEDDNGHWWALLRDVADPAYIKPGAVLIAGTQRFWSHRAHRNSR